MEELINTANKKGFAQWFSNYSEENHHLKGWRDRDEYLDEVEQPVEIKLCLIETWLRQIHNLKVNVDYFPNVEKWGYSIGNLTLKGKEFLLFQKENSSLLFKYESYDQAKEEGLKYALNLI